MAETAELVEMTAEIVSAYVTNSSVTPAELPGLIQQVHRTLSDIAAEPGQAAAPPAGPAVSIRRSITPEYIVCLEDGRRFKSLKRHLRTKYAMSPDQYRAKWGLPKDYPMVAPSYAAARSTLAKQMGLGKGSRKPAAAKESPRGRAKAAR